MLTSLYIHIPFCLKKCLYCDFNSMADSSVTLEEYAGAVLKEMALRAERLPGPVTAPTLYFGGGTPSLMAPDLVARLIDACRRLFGLVHDAEVTLEANPGTLTFEKLRRYRQAGINRLSLGVQSFNDRYLSLLGRVHTSREASDAFVMGREAGFDNVGIDLIHSLPGESLTDWLDDLDRAVRLGPEHISAYGLTIEEGTPFHALEKNGELCLPTEDESARMFRQTMEFLAEKGYEQYEISNFSRPGFRSRHNRVYWRRGNYLGFGAGAHSFLTLSRFGTRWRNSLSPDAYRASIGSAVLPEEEAVFLTERDAMAEFFFLGLRMMEGVDLGQFYEEFSVAPDDVWPGVIPRLVARGLLQSFAGRLRLTEQGIILSNRVFLEFL